MTVRPAWHALVTRAASTAILEAMTEESETFELSPEWRAAIERRVQGILSGKTKGIPANEAIAMLRRERDEERRTRGEASSRRLARRLRR